MITVSNPRVTLTLSPTTTATHARGHQPGEIYDAAEALRARDRGESAVYIYGAEQHDLRRYQAGALVLLPCELVRIGEVEVVTGSKWECFRVDNNPDYEPDKPYDTPMVDYPDFTSRRHRE